MVQNVMAGIILTLATVLCEISSHSQALLGNDSKILANDTFATHDFHSAGQENVKPVAQSSPASQCRELKDEKPFMPTSGFNRTAGSEWKRLFCKDTALDLGGDRGKAALKYQCKDLI